MTNPNQPRSLAALFPLLHRLPEPVQDAIAVALLAMIVIPGLASTARISADIWQGDREPHDYPGSPVKAGKSAVDDLGEWVGLGGDDDDSAEAATE